MEIKQTQHVVVNDLVALEAFLAGATVIAFDFETAPQKKWSDGPKAALDPHRGEIIGFSLVVSPIMTEKTGYPRFIFPFVTTTPMTRLAPPTLMRWRAAKLGF